MRTLLLFSICLFSAATFANEQKTMDPIGPHYPILTFEKNENPQNIMIIYTKLDGECHILKDPDSDKKPIFNFYWLMDHQKYKRVNSMIGRRVRDRLEVQPPSPNGFDVLVKDLTELKSDLKDPRIAVHADKKNGVCAVDATIKLGPSDGESVMRLDSIYSVARKTFWPPFRRVTAITLNGTDVKTGEKIKRTYSGSAED